MDLDFLESDLSELVELELILLFIYLNSFLPSVGVLSTFGCSSTTTVEVAAASFFFSIASNRGGTPRRLGFSSSTGISMGISIQECAEEFENRNKTTQNGGSQRPNSHQFSGTMGFTTHQRHKKILKLAKGYRGRQKNCYTIAVRSVIKAQSRAYVLVLIVLVTDMWVES